LPLDKFSFNFPTDRTVKLDIHPELLDLPARWQFWQCQPHPAYLVAICAERIDDASIVIRQSVPLVSERVIAQEFLRVSV
jgi:4'-phosphopantetheinyl transferase